MSTKHNHRLIYKMFNIFLGFVFILLIGCPAAYSDDEFNRKENLEKKADFKWTAVKGRLVYRHNTLTMDGSALWVVEDEHKKLYGIWESSGERECGTSVSFQGDKFNEGDEVEISKLTDKHDENQCRVTETYKVKVIKPKQ